MRFFFTNKIIGLLLFPFRYITIRFFKLDEIKINFYADIVLILDKGVNKITWNVENAYLVTISNLGIVNTSGELVINNCDLPSSVKIIVQGYNKSFRKVINFKKVNLEWRKEILPVINKREIVFESPKRISVKSITVPQIGMPVLNLTKPTLQIDNSEIINELKTI